MKKIFLGLLFLFIFSVFKPIEAFDFSFGLDDSLKELMQQGNHVVCLNAETKQISVPNDWKKPAVGTVKLTGATCNSPSGCKILRCNSSNTEIAANDHLINICKTHPENWVGCNKEGKIEEVEKKTAISKQVQPGCQEVKNFDIISMNNRKLNVLDVNAEEPASIPLGPVNIELGDSYVVHVDYEYFLSQPDDGTTLELGQGGEEITPGSENTQQLGIINFSFTEQEVEGSIKDCEVISWDPFGRVFDAVSLEPMSDIKVILIDDETGKQASMKFNRSFDITDIRGLFNIQVENEGMYELDVEVPVTHLFADSAKINPKYINIYSDIYQKGNVFKEETEIPTHHDIPLQPIEEPYHGAVAQLIEDSLKSYVSGYYGVYSGTTTYPYSKVCLIGEKTNKIIGDCVNADRYGKYSISVHRKKVPMEFLEVSVRKVDLNNINNNYPQESRVKGIGYEPLFSYIEGDAYDEKGNKLTNAKVNVRLASNDKIFYETTTDDSGLFIVYKKDLPFVEYYLEFVDSKSQKTIKKTTSDFVSDNQSFLNNEKINLVLGAKDNSPVINSATGQLNRIEKNTSNIDQKGKTSGYVRRMTDSRLIFVLLVLALLVVPVTIGIFLHIKKTSSKP